MNLAQLSEIFVVSGVNQVNENTFTALFHGYNLRGKIILPSVPTVDFIFYGNIDPDIQAPCDEFVPELFGKYGRFPIKVGNNFFSVLLDLSVRDVQTVKSILGEVTNFMMNNNCGALTTLPPEPAPEPPKPEQKPMPPKQVAKIVPQPPAPPKPAPKPPEQKPAVPFEKHNVLNRLPAIFILGINKISEDSFTSLYHGYNVVGKMPSADEEILELTFYGESIGDISSSFEKFSNEMKEKYSASMKNMSGSVTVRLNISGRADSDVKSILGEVSGFMMKHNIIAINFPNTVPKGVPYDPNNKNVQPSMPTVQPVNSNQGRQYSNTVAPDTHKSNDNFVGKFFKKFGKKP